MGLPPGDRFAGSTKPPELLGRHPEREVLDHLVESVVAGHSSSLVICGDPGMGKTALLGYLARRASPRCRVVRASGMQSEMELPFAAVHQLCVPVLGRLQQLSEPQQDALGTVFSLPAGPPPGRAGRAGRAFDGAGAATAVAGGHPILDSGINFSEPNGSQEIGGNVGDCERVNLPTTGSIQFVTGTLTLWTGLNCTGRSLVVKKDIANLTAIGDRFRQPALGSDRHRLTVVLNSS